MKEILQRIENLISKIKKQVEHLKALYLEKGNDDEFYQESLKLVELSEKLTLEARNLPHYSGRCSSHEDIQEIIDNTVKVEIGYTEDGFFCVRIPALLQKKERGGNQYIRSILWSAMCKFFSNKVRDVPEKAVLVYRHVYDEKYPNKRMRDHDNIEINQVSDIVAFWAMVDDAPYRCSHYYTSARGDCNRTEVYVVPEELFITFVDKEENIPKEGWKLYEFRQ